MRTSLAIKGSGQADTVDCVDKLPTPNCGTKPPEGGLNEAGTNPVGGIVFGSGHCAGHLTLDVCSNRGQVR